MNILWSVFGLSKCRYRKFLSQTVLWDGAEARSLGIDYLITNGIHRGDMERVWKCLDLPQTHCFPLVALVLGYPTAKPSHLKGRLDGPGVLHYEKYHRADQGGTRGADSPVRRPGHLALDEDWKARGYKHFIRLVVQGLAARFQAQDRETQMLRLLKRSGFVELQKA